MNVPVLEPPETEKINEEPTRVDVLNDDVNDFGHVISTFMRILAWGEEKAARKALEIHETGKATVFEGHLERAELIYEQLISAKLNAQIS